MIEAIKLAFHFDPERLKLDLNKFENDEWIDHFNTRGYDGKWKVIPLRGSKGAVHTVMQIYNDPNSTEFEDTSFLNKCIYFQEVLSTFECPLRAVRLLSLTAGSIIKEHSDLDLSFEDGEARIHIPITTNPDVEFYLNSNRYEMKEGETWYMNFTLPHRIANHGTTDRVHLILDCTVNNWLRNIFANLMTEVK